MGAAALRPYRESERRTARIHRMQNSHAMGTFGCALQSAAEACCFFRDDLVDLQAEALGYAGAVCGIGLVEVLDLQLLDAARMLPYCDDVADEALFGVGGHQAEEIARLV